MQDVFSLSTHGRDNDVLWQVAEYLEKDIIFPEFDHNYMHYPVILSTQQMKTCW